MTRTVNSEIVFASEVSFETTREIPHLFEGVVEIHNEKTERAKLSVFRKEKTPQSSCSYFMLKFLHFA